MSWSDSGDISLAAFMADVVTAESSLVNAAASSESSHELHLINDISILCSGKILRWHPLCLLAVGQCPTLLPECVWPQTIAWSVRHVESLYFPVRCGIKGPCPFRERADRTRHAFFESSLGQSLPAHDLIHWMSPRPIGAEGGRLLVYCTKFVRRLITHHITLRRIPRWMTFHWRGYIRVIDSCFFF